MVLEMELGSNDGGDDDDRTGIGFVEIFGRFSTQDALLLGTESVDKV